MKPSELLRIALGDLEKCEANDSYQIDMRQWVRSGEVCSVCLAGCVMVQTLNMLFWRGQVLNPRMAFDEWPERLYAIESFARGKIDQALRLMGCCVAGEIRDTRTITRYRNSIIEFKIDMFQLVLDLEEERI